MTESRSDTGIDLVVFGGAGDLARRKLLPALYFLHRSGDLPRSVRIVACARHAWSRLEYLQSITTSSREHVGALDFEDETWHRFLERVQFVSLDAQSESPHGALADALAGAEDRVRIFYLATPSDVFSPIVAALAESGLAGPESRIVLEKPIGRDLPSARAINESVGRVFDEERIYRIDHYLGKETVQNLVALRFANALFEPMWTSQHVDHVQITVAETIGIEGRGGYYDNFGALRDMVQNHMLQLLCLVAMEPPARLEAREIREEKVKVVRALRPIVGADLARDTVRGQYQSGAIGGRPVSGYLDEEGISAGSTTETFVALRAHVDNWRWAGVPFYVRTGKRMHRRVSEIVIQFRRVPHVLFSEQAHMQDNRLVIRLQPDENVRLGMMVKAPGSKLVLRPVHLALDLGEAFAGRRSLGAYERLLLDVIRGNPTLFMHRAEVEEAWSWVEPISAGWQDRGDPPRRYIAGTQGPPESIALVVRDDRSWYEDPL